MTHEDAQQLISGLEHLQFVDSIILLIIVIFGSVIGIVLMRKRP